MKDWKIDAALGALALVKQILFRITMTIIEFLLTAFAAYSAGVATVVLLALRFDNRKRKSAPVRYAAATGASSVIESQSFGEFPGDWGGPVWSPRGSRGLA
jgi:hypothetical protein